MIGPRYAIIQGDAVVDKRLTEIHLRVLLMLGRRTDRNGWCEVSQTKMAATLGYSRQRINVAFRDLTEWKYVEKRDQFSSRTNGRTISRYRTLMDRETQDIALPLSRGGDIPMSPLEATTPVTSEGDNLTTSFLTTIEKTNKKENGLGFLDFWEQYPRKVAKPKAEVAYLNALKKHSHGKIMAGTGGILLVGRNDNGQMLKTSDL